MRFYKGIALRNCCGMDEHWSHGWEWCPVTLGVMRFTLWATCGGMAIEQRLEY